MQARPAPAAASADGPARAVCETREAAALGLPYPHPLPHSHSPRARPGSARGAALAGEPEPEPELPPTSSASRWDGGIVEQQGVFTGWYATPPCTHSQPLQLCRRQLGRGVSRRHLPLASSSYQA